MRIALRPSDERDQCVMIADADMRLNICNHVTNTLFEEVVDDQFQAAGLYRYRCARA